MNDFYAPSAAPMHINADDIVKGLNDRQQEAVEHSGSPLLVMAGAGSGKTRVLTRRIAYKLATGQARPGEILAITFTNKAAAEMRERVEALVGLSARRMLVSTFHSACVRFLRYNYEAAGLKSSFTIYDAQDSKNLIKSICDDLNIDTKQFAVRAIASRISDLKNELITPDEYNKLNHVEPMAKKVGEIYPQYQKRLQQSNAVDFDDLIMRTVMMLKAHPSIAEYYHRTYRHILVDEYQDTNHAQYVLVKLLVGDGSDGIEPGELTVVGDSDQSIYAFRGATIRNIDEFEKDFRGAKTILLEQNYRSTQNILSAANAVIKENPGRRPKNLWTDSGEGEKIVICEAPSDREEAQFIIDKIDELTGSALGSGNTETYKYSDIAIFYRMNAQSRAVEEALMKSGINYRVIGGMKFYERKEVKDAIAYLHCVDNPDDTVSLQRILNTPRRGLGAKTIGVLNAWADMNAVSIGRAIASVWWHEVGKDAGQISEGLVKDTPSKNKETSKVPSQSVDVADMNASVIGYEVDDLAKDVDFLSTKARKELAAFWQMLIDMRIMKSAGRNVADILEAILEKSGYVAMLEGSKDAQDKSRMENLAELHSVAEDFVPEDPQQALVEFLERVSLVSDADTVPGDGDRTQVTLMTVHTAKGLEFPVVFVTGLEDGVFPHQRSMSEPGELAEERRLCYVAITRAQQRLFLTRSMMRMQWGDFQEYPASRFLDDIPKELCEGVSTHDLFAGGFASQSYGTTGYGSPRKRREPKMSAEHYRATTPRRMAKRMTGSKDKTPSVRPAAGTVYQVGDRVNHQSFGLGRVKEVSGSGSNAAVVVDFGDGSLKRLLVRMAPMEKL